MPMTTASSDRSTDAATASPAAHTLAPIRNQAFTGAAGAALLLLTGCTTPGPRYGEQAVQHRLAIDAPAVAAMLERAPRNDPAAVEARWRELLHTAPLTPHTSIEIALLRSPRLDTAFARLGLSRAELIAATRLPNPTLGGSRIGADGAYKSTVEFALGLGDLLLQPARRRLGSADYERAERVVAHELLALVADVESAWYAAVSARQVATMRDAVAQAATLGAQLAQRFFDAGNISALQLAAERAAASQARLAAADAAVDARRARLELLRSLGLDADPTLQIPDRLPEPTPPPTTEVDALIELALQRRADLDAARREVALLEDALQVARRWRLLGDLSIGAEREKEASGEVVRGPTLELALPLFDQGQAGIARAEARLAAARAAQRELELEVGTAVRNAVDRLDTAAAAVVEHREVLLPAHHTIVDQQQRRQNFMLIGQFELLLAKQQEYDAWQGQLEAIRDFWIARSDLERAIGGALPSAATPGADTGDAPGIGPQDLPGMPAEPDLYGLPPPAPATRSSSTPHHDHAAAYPAQGSQP